MNIWFAHPGHDHAHTEHAVAGQATAADGAWLIILISSLVVLTVAGAVTVLILRKRKKPVAHKQ